MDVALSSWFVILLAAFAANIPFFNERLFAIVDIGRTIKPFRIRLVEWLVLYFSVLAIAYALESRAGNVFPQKWEFYAITLCLFAVFSYPGFVLSYLRKRHA